MTNPGQTQHLEMIQSVISRMCQNSFAMKGWAVTLISAILLVAHEIAGAGYLLVALLPAIVFWGYDAFYLRQERLYRELFDSIRMQSEEDWLKNPFSMSTAIVESRVQSWPVVWFSRSVVWLYLPMIIIIIGITVYTACEKHSKEGANGNGKESVLQLPLRSGQLACCDCQKPRSQ